LENRRAFTLIEILVSLVITLIMMGAVVTLFGVVTDSVSGSRALLETADRLRAARNRISLDLQGATVTPIPPRRPENDEGYLEIVEGAQHDFNFAGYDTLLPNDLTFASLFGDCDDALLLTTRSRGEPFIGKFNTSGTIESQVAEVAYFLRQDGPIIGFKSATAPPPLEVRLFTLYRRCLLVVPSGQALTAPFNANFYLANDVSARAGSGNAIANTLGDLTKPENRFGRIATSFPSKFDTTITGFTGNRLGDDVILTNVLAFDVQVYEPGAPVFIDPLPPATTPPPVAVEPQDLGYNGSNGNNGKLPNWIAPPTPYNFPDAKAPISFGAYTDLGVRPNYNPPIGPPNNFPRAPFLLKPEGKSFGGVTASAVPPYSYDTWSLHYEADGQPQNGTTDTGLNGLDDDGNGVVDDLGEANNTNGVDDDGNGFVDDKGEMDTLPPYSAPLRGLRITIRVYEPGSQQIRQVTVVQDFLQQ
jgi:prepilin-type N-terminal cleavage/methylation domain-containing protein